MPGYKHFPMAGVKISSRTHSRINAMAMLGLLMLLPTYLNVHIEKANMKLFVLLLVMNNHAVPIYEDIYTQSECNKRAEYLMSVRNIEVVCGEVLRE